MKNFLHSIAHGLAAFAHLLTSGKFVEAVNKADAIIEKYLPQALEAAQIIDTAYPNRTVEDFENLAAKYKLHWNEGMSNDEKETMLQNAALQEFHKLVPENVSNSIARNALNGVVAVLRIVKSPEALDTSTHGAPPSDAATT